VRRDEMGTYQNAETLSTTDDSYETDVVCIRNITQDKIYAALFTCSGTNWRAVTWLDSPDEVRVGYTIDCYAWVEDSVIYLPRDGQTSQGQVMEDGTPDPDAGWYDPQTGLAAIRGIPGTTMVRGFGNA
jgi:hypothetical protein